MFSRNTHRIIDESIIMKRYMYIGYGIPAVLLLLGFVHVHLSSDSDTLFELNCFIHRKNKCLRNWWIIANFSSTPLSSFLFISEYTIMDTYVFIPILLSLLANLIFFIDCQRLLWNTYSLQNPTINKRTLKILKYRCQSIIQKSLVRL